MKTASNQFKAKTTNERVVLPNMETIAKCGKGRRLKAKNINANELQ